MKVLLPPKNKETLCLNGQELTDVNSADSLQSTTVMSEEVVQQIRALTDPLPKQLDLYCVT